MDNYYKTENNIKKINLTSFVTKKSLVKMYDILTLLFAEPTRLELATS